MLYVLFSHSNSGNNTLDPRSRRCDVQLRPLWEPPPPLFYKHTALSLKFTDPYVQSEIQTSAHIFP